MAFFISYLAFQVGVGKASRHTGGRAGGWGPSGGRAGGRACVRGCVFVCAGVRSRKLVSLVLVHPKTALRWRGS